MALTAAQANLMLESRAEGMSFDRVVTIGRQTNYLGSASSSELRKFPKLSEIDGAILQASYAEPFLRGVLGANHIDSIDMSNYEGATILHDMNDPIPARFHAQYNAVIESGTLEHVFNFPVALLNCMKLVGEGGSVFLSLPVNNFAGHGLYQFSPELFFRVFDSRNGFTLKSVFLAESWTIGVERGIRLPLYSAIDPARIRHRVNLVNCYPTFALVHAVRTGNVPDTVSAQQSDYTVAWSRNQPEEPASASLTAPLNDRQHTTPIKRLARWALMSLPQRWQMWIRANYERKFHHAIDRNSFSNPVNPGARGDSAPKDRP